MSVIMYFLVAGILGCILAMIVVAVRSTDAKALPAMEAISLLGRKETTMYEDLSAIALKMGFKVFAKVPLSMFLRAESENKRYKLGRQLEREILPLVLAEPKTTKIIMVIMPPDFKSPFCVSVLDEAKIPYLQLNNYNLPGLEKAIKDKLSGVKTRRGRSSAPPPPLFEGQPAEQPAEQ